MEDLSWIVCRIIYQYMNKITPYTLILRIPRFCSYLEIPVSRLLSAFEWRNLAGTWAAR